MPRAALILADLYVTPESLPAAAQVRRLPALERALARAASRSTDVPDWRRWLQRRLGAPQPTDTGAAWLATPVHYVAGLDTLRLHGEGLLRLTLGDQQRLAADFAQAFHGSGWQLQASGAREMLLRGPPLAAEAPDPARFAGQSMRAAQPQGPGHEALRRLQSEIEMWLHSADYRGATGSASLKVNGLWLWGRAFAAAAASLSLAGAANEDLSEARGAQLFANDLASRGIAAAAGVAHAGLPGRWQDLAYAQADLNVVIGLAAGDVTAQLESIEAYWLEPALSDLRAGRLASLELVCGERHWLIDGAARWRWWRRRRHWMPELLAC